MTMPAVAERLAECKQPQTNDNAIPDRVVEIERLAALDPIEYDVAREAASKSLGIRTQTLDRAVTKKRKELGLDTEDGKGQGRVAKIKDILPWHEPVDGDRLATT